VNKEQKIAWLILGYLVYLAASGLVLPFLKPHFGDTAVLGSIVFGWVAFFSVFLYIGCAKKPKGDTTEDDERTKILSLQASLAGAMMSYLAVFVYCAFVFWRVRSQGEGTISVYVFRHILYTLMGVVGMTIFGVRSLVILLLYRLR